MTPQRDFCWQHTEWTGCYRELGHPGQHVGPYREPRPTPPLPHPAPLGNGAPA